VLTKTNYFDWAMMMRVKLKARWLWVIVDKGDLDPQEDKLALDALMSVEPPVMLAIVADNKMVKETWDSITTMHVGDDCVKKAAAKQMHSQFDRTLFWESVSVEDFALCLNRMVATLATLGEVVKEYLVVKKILHCVPPRMK
jgi:hypothetical protein